MSGPISCGGPEFCCDDLCAHADEGICGIPHPHTIGEPCSSASCWECRAHDDDEEWADEDTDECPACGFDTVRNVLVRTPRSKEVPCPPCLWAHDRPLVCHHDPLDVCDRCSIPERAVQA